MAYSVRAIHSLDIEKLIEVERSAAQAFLSVPELAWIAESPVLSADTHLELVVNAYSFVIVNEQDQPVGFLYAKKQGQDFYILEFDVNYDVQKQGIGRQLIEYAIDYARKQGYEAVTLTTFIHVAWNRLFYEKLGFQIIHDFDLPLYLKTILDKEVVSGFSRETRCAMRLYIK